MNNIENILYIYVDSLRKDFISFYGWDHSTPNIDGLAEQSTVLSDVITVPSTYESLTQQLTGLYSWRKKWRELGNTKTFFDFFPTKRKFMVSLQKPFGAAISNEEYAQRFGNYPIANFSEMLKILSWCRNEPFIGFFGFWVLRDPISYNTKNAEDCVFDYKDRLDTLDDFIGIIIKKLKKYNIFDRTLIVLVADHGEYFSGYKRNYQGTHTKGHGGWRYEEVINIPCIIYIPDQDSKILSCCIETVDLTPTLLGILGVNPEIKFDGVDFSKQFLTGKSIYKKYSLIDRTTNADYLTVRSSDGWKLLLDDKNEHKLFNYENDPLEENNVIDKNENIVNELKDFAESQRASEIILTKDDYIDRFNGYKNIEYVKDVFNKSNIEDSFRNRINYSKSNWVTDGASLDAIFNLDICKSGNFLDVGSGTGVVANYAAEKGYNTYAIDISPHMLSQIKDDRVKCVISRVEKIIFDNSFFDTVVARGLFQYVEKANVGFKEIKRILRTEGGNFIFFNAVPPEDSFYNEWKNVQESVLKIKKFYRTCNGYINTIKEIFENVKYSFIYIKQSIKNWAESNNLDPAIVLSEHRKLSVEYKKSCNFEDSGDDAYINLKFLLLKAQK